MKRRPLHAFHAYMMLLCSRWYLMPMLANTQRKREVWKWGQARWWWKRKYKVKAKRQVWTLRNDNPTGTLSVVWCFSFEAVNFVVKPFKGSLTKQNVVFFLLPHNSPNKHEHHGFGWIFEHRPGRLRSRASTSQESWVACKTNQLRLPAGLSRSTNQSFSDESR